MNKLMIKKYFKAFVNLSLFISKCNTFFKLKVVSVNIITNTEFINKYCDVYCSLLVNTS